MKKLILGLVLTVGMLGSLGIQGAEAHSGCYPRPYYRHTHFDGCGHGWYRPAYFHRHFWGCGCPGWGYRARFYDYGYRRCGW